MLDKDRGCAILASVKYIESDHVRSILSLIFEPNMERAIVAEVILTTSLRE